MHTAWGATCGRHHNSGDTAECKKQLSGTSDEVRRLVLWWLIMGHDVPVAGNFARKEHLKIPMRRFGFQ